MAPLPPVRRSEGSGSPAISNVLVTCNPMAPITDILSSKAQPAAAVALREFARQDRRAAVRPLTSRTPGQTRMSAFSCYLMSP